MLVNVEDEEDLCPWGVLEDSTTFLSYDKFVVLPLDKLIRFYFSYGDASSGLIFKQFQSDLVFESHLESLAKLLKAELQCAIFHIGLVIIPWLWMGLLSDKIVVKAGYLSNAQIAYWENFYLNTFAEFLCVNQLDIGQCPKVEVEAEAHLHTLKAVLSSPSPDAAPRVLVPLGAGKDSITVFEMVSEKLEHMEGSSSAWFFLGDHCGEYARSWRYDAIVSASGASEPPVVMAHVFEDPAWESSCRPGVVPCGHPWAGLVAFCSVLASAYLGFNYIAVGNERSANFGNTTYMGLPVNHQYDKSFEFESAAHAYVNAHVAPGLHYFSALQHLWELQVAREFCKHPKYLPLFISCNEALGGTRWCGACSKCLFVCILLGAFLEPPQVWAIFGDDLLQKQEMAGVLEELLGRGGKSKPFECVGTPEEVAHALFLCKQKYKEFLGGRRMPRLLADLELPPDAGRLRLKEDVNCENLLPDWLRPDSEA